MATNADENAADDSENVSDEEALRRAKYDSDDVDTSQEEDETDAQDEADDDSADAGDDDGQTDDSADDDDSEDESQDDSDDDDSGYVKRFENIKGDTLEDYTRNLEEAYDNSTAEAIRLKRENDGLKTGESDDADGDSGENKVDTSDPTALYMKQKMDEEITAAYTEFSKHYPQVSDEASYGQFVGTVKTLSQTILSNEQRLAPPKELYSKAAVILGWEPTETKPNGKERVGMAIKGRAAVSKTSSGPKKTAPPSKVTQAMIVANRKMYPSKTDQQIREELEPYVQ